MGVGSPEFEADSAVALATLIAAVEALSAAATPEDVGRIVRTAARRLTGADGVAVVLRQGDDVRYIDEDAVAPLWKGGVFPADRCISGWAILNRQTVVIADVFADPRIPADLYAPTFVKSLAVAPVRPSDPLAAVVAYWDRVREPTGREVAALETIARATAVALENVRLRVSLQDALFEAEASSRAKLNFLTNISHEVRTPLNGLVGSVGLLAQTSLSTGQAELIEVMKASGSDLEHVLTDVLDFARMQSDETHVEPQPFHLGELAREVGRLFEMRLLAKSVAFRVEVAAPADRVVSGDRLRIKQILIALMDNALKFTRSGEVVLSADQGDGAESYSLQVADTGVGFAPEDSELIFGRFVQGDSSLTRAYGGTGLGLAISRRLAEVLDGKLTAMPRTEGGAVFTLVLPLAPFEAQDEPERAESLPLGERRIRVLIVDDHPVNRKVAELMLSQAGAEISMAVNGEEACRAFEKHSFDVVLMDVQMPVMDGITATRTIREMEARRSQTRTPILMLTANTLPEHVNASREAGADRHLAKPIQLDTLFDALQETLDKQAA